MKRKFELKEKVEYKKVKNERVIASVVLLIEGREVQSTESGTGPVDAVIKAIKSASKVACKLERYKVEAISLGNRPVESYDMGEARVVLGFKNRHISGCAQDEDIVEASAQAYINALNFYYKSE